MYGFVECVSKEFSDTDTLKIPYFYSFGLSSYFYDLESSVGTKFICFKHNGVYPKICTPQQYLLNLKLLIWRQGEIVIC